METPPSSTESWDKKVNELINQVMDRVDIMDFHEKMIVLAQRIRERYPDYMKYRYYHKLIGSTPVEEVFEYIDKDFEGDCSVIAFFEGLLDKEKNKNIS